MHFHKIVVGKMGGDITKEYWEACRIASRVRRWDFNRWSCVYNNKTNYVVEFGLKCEVCRKLPDDSRWANSEGRCQICGNPYIHKSCIKEEK